MVARLTLLIALLLVFAPFASARPRQNIGDAFEKGHKPEKKPSPAAGWSPEDKKRLMNEVASGFYADAVKAKNAGRLVEAQMLFERVLILNPASDAAKTQLAEIKRKNEASAKSQKTPAKDATNRLLTKLWTEADAASRAQNWDEAQLAYRKILAIDPGNKKAKAKLDASEVKLFERLKLRGEERERAGDTEGALNAYQLALLHGEDDGMAERLETLKKRLNESNRKKSDEIYAEALNASQQGNNDKALTLCRRALQMDPSNIQAERMQERLEKRYR